jgi:hypothetical protein
MATQDDKLVARCLRIVANINRLTIDKNSGDMLDEKANELDPPEDRATRIAATLLRKTIPYRLDDLAALERAIAKVLREEGV